MIYSFQIFVSIGMVEEKEVTDVVSGYVLSFGGRTAYILPAIVCALAASRLLSFSENAVSFTQHRSLSQIWGCNIAAASLLSGVVSSFYLVLQFAVFVIFTQVVGATTEGVSYLEFGLRSFVVLFLWGLIGFGLAYVIRNQAATLVLLLVFGFVIEPIATGMLNESQSFNEWVGYLPGSLNWALAWPANGAGAEGATTSTNTWQSIVGLLGYSLVSFAAALAVSFRSGDRLMKRGR
ncbi:hypothetical protein ACOI9F_13550 [Corynebacterium striatum]|uniref:hypothetical protein n=1 Tax=Corynebacterium striatum TaxID=43770 RepID=UPI003B5CD91A